VLNRRATSQQSPLDATSAFTVCIVSGARSTFPFDHISHFTQRTQYWRNGELTTGVRIRHSHIAQILHVTSSKKIAKAAHLWQ
jgi:hypothetical protein